MEKQEILDRLTEIYAELEKPAAEYAKEFNDTLEEGEIGRIKPQDVDFIKVFMAKRAIAELLELPTPHSKNIERKMKNGHMEDTK